MTTMELVLRTTESSGVVKEQILIRFDFGQAAPEPDVVHRYSGLCIDEIQHKVSYQGKELPLTEKYEFQTLAYLARKPGRVYTKEQIFQTVWKEEPAGIENNIYCVIGSIRRKLKKYTDEEYIQTVWGVGYKFVDVPGEWSSGMFYK